MFKVLIADDDLEDRELLKLEIRRALEQESPPPAIRFQEAVSVRDARSLLATQVFDLMTLDIEFDRMTEGIDALPDLFESYPALTIIVVSGKLDKGEVSERLFRFTKDNVLKGKRWARHFDVLDKKDNKTEAIRRAYDFSKRQQEGADGIRDLFLLAESYLEKNMLDKCLEVYQKIQQLVPGDAESTENIRIVKSGVSVSQALEYYRAGDHVVAALLLGHAIENRLKEYSRAAIGRVYPVLSDTLKAMQQARVSRSKQALFGELMSLRNKAIHQPADIRESDFQTAVKKIDLLGEAVP